MQNYPVGLGLKQLDFLLSDSSSLNPGVQGMHLLQGLLGYVFRNEELKTPFKFVFVLKINYCKHVTIHHRKIMTEPKYDETD